MLSGGDTGREGEGKGAEGCEKIPGPKYIFGYGLGPSSWQ